MARERDDTVSPQIPVQRAVFYDVGSSSMWVYTGLPSILRGFVYECARQGLQPCNYAVGAALCKISNLTEQGDKDSHGDYPTECEDGHVTNLLRVCTRSR